MRLIVCPLAATVCLVGATPKPVPSPTKAAPQAVISEADVRATIAHMERLAHDQQDMISVKDRLNAQEAETIKNQAVELRGVDAQLAAVQKAKNDLDGQIKTLNKDLTAERWARWKAMIFGWPVAVFVGVVIGVALSLFSRLGAKVAALGARVGLRAATGI